MGLMGLPGRSLLFEHGSSDQQPLVNLLPLAVFDTVNCRKDADSCKSATVHGSGRWQNSPVDAQGLAGADVMIAQGLKLGSRKYKSSPWT